MTLRRLIGITLSLGLTVLLLWLFLRGSDWHGVWKGLRSASPGYLALTFPVGVVSLLLRTLRWQFLLRPVRPSVRFYPLFKATLASFAVTGVLPGRVGELARPYLASRWEKIPLPPVLAEQLHETADAFADTPVDETFTRVLRGLTRALADRRIVEIDYEAGVYDPSKPVRRVRLHPYAIEPSAHTRALYVIGWDEEREARRTFKVERIQSVALTAETFPSPGESVAREMLDAWDVIGDDTPVEVVIRFDPSVTQRVHETRWHSSQVEELEDDGSLLWRARVSGVLEIRSWILGWGPAAEVLEPDELREWIAQQHAAAVARYDDRRG